MSLAFSLMFSTRAALASNLPNHKVVSLREYITLIEKQKHIPSGLLSSIAKIESGYRPYAVNIDGRTYVAKNKSEALYHIHKALSEGITNIDIGVMQVNWRWHGQNFDSTSEMLDPKANITYAADLLCGLYEKHGDWHKALRYYHSANPDYYRKYSRKIVLAWLGG